MNNVTWERNLVYKQVNDCKDRTLILYGGGGSGKSVYVAERKIKDLLTIKNQRWGMIRKHLKHIRQSQFQELKNVVNRLNLMNLFTFNESDMRIKCNYSGSEMIAFGMDDREKIKSIAEISGSWIEEASELDPEDYDQIQNRTRTKNAPYLQDILTFNPIRKNHWIKEKIFKDRQPELGVPLRFGESFNVAGRSYEIHTTILRTNYLHNRFLDNSYYAILERFRTTNPEYYKVYALAEWGDLELGLIFKREFYSEYDYVPADARGVIYCDPNLAKKSQGDTTAIVSLLFSPSAQKYYVINAECKSFSTTSELLDTVLSFRKDERTKFIGFDGNVSQESQWTEHVQNYSRIKGFAFPIIEYKRYKVDELSKMAQIAWCDGNILFPPNFKYTKTGELFLGQLYSFAGKKHTQGKDDAPDALICALEFIFESGFAAKSKLNFNYKL